VAAAGRSLELLLPCRACAWAAEAGEEAFREGKKERR